MRVAIASDHAGFEQKQLLAAYLAEDLAQDVLDLGPDSDDRVDYPDFANKVAHALANGDADYGVLVCGTGIGMAMAQAILRAQHGDIRADSQPGSGASFTVWFQASDT